ncbi:membrane protein [Sphaerotilus microaerophilus]|uniref:Membrane protein n=2 Tax=Sphaerotilus microaerophilus TaxID=2914710 RepID=A0ABN6PQZ9_9BURK|nr:membrane protein [Sphaerotilus sp. FB-5]
MTSPDPSPGHAPSAGRRAGRRAALTSASALMVAAAFLFATMGVCVKLASAYYGSGEIVMYRGLVGVLVLAVLAHARGETLRTRVPGMHLWRAIVGVSALSLWFYSISGLPLPTAMTLNYMSSVWMALFLIGGGILAGGSRIDGRLMASVLAGFAGVAMVLRPTIEAQQLWHGLLGLLSGVLSAMAYLQVTALGRVGEPESRVVFYFSLGGLVAGAVLSQFTGGLHTHTWRSAALLLAVGGLATVAQLMMTRAYATGRPLVNASLQYLGIAFAFVYGVLLFGEPVHLVALGGTLLIVAAGIAAASLRQDNQARVRPAETLPPDIEP